MTENDAHSLSNICDEEAEEVRYSDPGQEVRTAGPSFLPALANVLQHMASLAGRPQRMTRFHAVRVPQVGICDYLSRIGTYFQCSHECFVLALVYIDRIVKLHPEFTISNLTIHRLLVTSVMLSAKFFDDLYYSNAYYAKVGGVRPQELNALEAQFLRLLDWRLHVLPQEYDQYRNHVMNAVRGNMSASDSFTLYQQPQIRVPYPEAATTGSPQQGTELQKAESKTDGASSNAEQILEGSSALASAKMA